jgi:hypothetical protein
MSKSSKIIVGGCSFTDKDFSIKARPKIDPFPSWPELLAKKTGKEIINTAKCGSGNRRIYQTVLNELLKHDDVEQVIVGWTEWTRQDFLVEGGFNGDGWHSIIPRKTDEKDRVTKAKVVDEKVLFEFYMNAFNFDFPKPNQIVAENLNNFYSLQCICKERNIKLNMFQMLYPINSMFADDDEKMNTIYQMQFFKSVLSHSLLLEMDNCFWGWPVFEHLGGMNLTKYLTKKNLYHRVSHLDAHPNKETHENIMEFILSATS